MGKKLFGVLACATIISASLYSKVGDQAANRMAVAAPASSTAVALAPRPHATVMPTALAAAAVPDTVALASLQPAQAQSVDAPAQPTRLAKAPPPAHTGWLVPTAATPPPGMTLPAVFPAPTDDD